MNPATVDAHQFESLIMHIMYNTTQYMYNFWCGNVHVLLLLSMSMVNSVFYHSGKGLNSESKVVAISVVVVGIAGISEVVGE